MNLARITLQWRRGSVTQTAFRIRIAPAATGEAPYELFVPYEKPTGANTTIIQELDAAYEVAEPIWRYIAQRHAGSEVRLTVAGHDPATNRLATSEDRPIAIHFSPDPVEGGFFYLGTEPPFAGIQRHVFGARTAEPVVRPGTAANFYNCGGCHSLSRDGSTLAFAATYAGNLTVSNTRDFENPTVRPPPPPDKANAVSPAVSPNGKYVVAREGVSGSLVLYDTTSDVPRSVRTVGDTEGRIDYPEWSPDGREIVATRARPNNQTSKVYSAMDGHVVVLPFSDGWIGKPEVVASEMEQVHSYPSWSPDGQWIVFVSSPVGTESYRNPNTRLRLVRRRGGPIINLDGATPDGVGFSSTVPRFAPTGQRNCDLMFIAFQSRMDYGILRRNRGAVEGGWPQLWMAAIDLSLLPADPSMRPIWLPFQDINQLNLLPVWSASLPCIDNGGCGAGAECRSGRCEPQM